jgi:hypothetical protein
MGVNEKIPTRYLVRLNHNSFFKARTPEGKVLSTKVMSFARGMGYDAADEVARTLQEMGFVGAVVSDLYGQPIDLKTLNSVPSTDGLKEFLGIWMASSEVGCGN